MQDLINKHLATGLTEFQGLHIVGRVPVTQKVINDFIAEFLQSRARKVQTAQPEPGTGSPVDIDVNILLPMVKKAYIEVQDGKIIAQFELRV